MWGHAAAWGDDVESRLTPACEYVGRLGRLSPTVEEESVHSQAGYHLQARGGRGGEAYLEVNMTQ